MDLTETIVPKSDQLNADDLITGPVTVTVESVDGGSAEQPVNVHLVEFPGRPFKPSKTVRRVLVAAWGPETDVYAGRRMTLFGDPTVRWAGQEVGGIRVSALSHISQTLKLSLAEASAKVRTGAPGDDEADYALPIWAGVIPVRQHVLAPEDDPRLLPGLTPPRHITDFKLG